jgi:DNA polymerase-4
MLIHADGDAFFASVEERDDPSLAGVPFAVASHVVMSASYAARAHGIHGAMPLRQAQRLFPGLRVVEPHPERYEQASAELFGLFRELTPFVEPGSLEEAFLDVALVGKEPVAEAGTLRRRARDELGLPVSVGVGTTKLMAKVASRRAKPDGLVVITWGEDRALRRALRLDEVWGVGPAKVEALRRQGIRTVGDLVDREVRDLAPIVGVMIARRLAAVAAGTDDASIRVPGERRSAGASRTLMRATRTASTIDATWANLLESALGRLPPGVEVTRLDGLVRYEDGFVVEQADQPAAALADPDEVRARARALLARTRWSEDGRAVVHLGINLLCRPSRRNDDQLALW